MSRGVSGIDEERSREISCSRRRSSYSTGREARDQSTCNRTASAAPVQVNLLQYLVFRFLSLDIYFFPRGDAPSPEVVQNRDDARERRSKLHSSSLIPKIKLILEPGDARRLRD